MNYNSKKIRQTVIDHLRLKDIPTNEALPTIEKWAFKSSSEVAQKIVVLYALTGLAHDADPAALKGWLTDNHLVQSLTSSEKIYFEKELSSKEILNLSWKQEALFALCWSGSIVQEIGLPNSECNLGKVFPEIPPEVEVSDFLQKFRLRSPDEIAFQIDLCYCLHWTIRHPECWGESEGPCNLNKDVLVERRRALEWLSTSSIGWDEIALDT